MSFLDPVNVIFSSKPRLTIFCFKELKYFCFEGDNGPTIRPWKFLSLSFDSNSIKPSKSWIRLILGVFSFSRFNLEFDVFSCANI